MTDYMEMVERVQTVEKQQRIVNKELLEIVRRLFCIACAAKASYEEINKAVQDLSEVSKYDPVMCTPHHVITVGAGGPDEAWNLLPSCIKHHTQVHQLGLKKFADQYSTVVRWLIAGEWRYDVYRKKWRHGEWETI